MQLASRDRIGLVMGITIKVELVLQQLLELETENDGARVRVTLDQAATPRLMKRIEVIGGVARSVDVNLREAVVRARVRRRRFEPWRSIC